MKDAGGAALAVRPSRAVEATRDARAPAWFAAGLAASRDVPVVVNGARIGSVEIVPEPRDEIAEVWGNTVALGTVALIVNVAVIGMLYLLFGRVLDPLTGVSPRARRSRAAQLPGAAAAAARTSSPPSPTVSTRWRRRSTLRAPRTSGSLTG